MDEAFGGLAVDPGMEKMMRTTMPELPDDPTPEQVTAWVELAELVRDPGFRPRIRGMTEYAAAEKAAGRPPLDRHTGQAVSEKAQAALASGIAADSPEARPVVEEIVATFAAATGSADGPAYRAKLLESLRAGTDARAERYWRLLGTINGWPGWPDATPAFEWLLTAMEAGAPSAG